MATLIDTLRISVLQSRWLLSAILILAVVIRFLAAIVIPDQSSALFDAVGYREAAAQLLAKGLFDSPYIMPLYPVLIAITGPGKGQLFADIALSVVIVWLVYALTAEMFKDKLAASLAALWTAFYLPLVFIATVGLSETLFISGMLASFLSWYRGRMVTGSVFAVLTIMTRPVFDLAAPLLTLYFCLAILRWSPIRSLAMLAIYAAIYCVLMAPWWFHNEVRYHKFVRLNLGFGTTLYAGNNPLNLTGGGNIKEDYVLDEFLSISDPVDQDRAIRNAALGYMVANPSRVVELAVLKFMRMWRLWPRNENYASASTVFLAVASFVPVLFLTLVYFFCWGWRERFLISPVILFACYYVAAHMLLVGTIRYRLPLEPFMIMFSCVALSRTLDRSRLWK